MVLKKNSQYSIIVHYGARQFEFYRIRNSLRITVERENLMAGSQIYCLKSEGQYCKSIFLLALSEKKKGETTANKLLVKCVSCLKECVCFR